MDGCVRAKNRRRIIAEQRIFLELNGVESCETAGAEVQAGGYIIGRGKARDANSEYGEQRAGVNVRAEGREASVP